MGIHRAVSLAYGADVIEQARPAHISLLLKGGRRHSNVIALSSRVSNASHYSGDNSEGHKRYRLVLGVIALQYFSSLFLLVKCKPAQINFSDN